MYDVIIIGGGPAGYTAGLYNARAELSTLILEGDLPGGRISLTDIVENYPGISEPISGYDLSQIMRDQAEKAGAELKMDSVKTIDKEKDLFNIKTFSDITYQGLSVIIATGTTDKKLSIPGEKKYTGRGVSYCATCDGPFFKDKKVAVIGGGDSAVKEALFLTNLAKSVSVIHRRNKLRAEKVIQTKAFSKKNMNFIWDSVVEKIDGDNKVEKLIIKNVKTGEISKVDFDGVFVLIGSIPNTNFIKNLQITNEKGFIKANDVMETSIKGLFAAGDVISKIFRQVTTAVGDGSLAAYSSQEYIESLK